MSAIALSAKGRSIGIISCAPFGLPGRLTIRVLPLIPAVPRDRDDNGCILEHSMVQNVTRPSQDL